MGERIDQHWGDGVADGLGTLALGLGVSVSASLLALHLGWPVMVVTAAAAALGLALGWLLMRRVPGHAGPMLPSFEAVAIDPVVDEPLLLEDVLEGPPADSRVVHLFGTGDVPTAGQLQARIDRHLGASPAAGALPPPDATDALHAALEDIRRSLRQG